MAWKKRLIEIRDGWRETIKDLRQIVSDKSREPDEILGAEHEIFAYNNAIEEINQIIKNYHESDTTCRPDFFINTNTHKL